MYVFRTQFFEFSKCIRTLLCIKYCIMLTWREVDCKIFGHEAPKKWSAQKFFAAPSAPRKPPFFPIFCPPPLVDEPPWRGDPPNTPGPYRVSKWLKCHMKVIIIWHKVTKNQHHGGKNRKKGVFAAPMAPKFFFEDFFRNFWDIC